MTAAYSNSLRLAEQHEAKSIAFPSISTGSYGFPVDRAAMLALRTVICSMDSAESVELVRFVLRADRTYDTYKRALNKIIGAGITISDVMQEV